MNPPSLEAAYRAAVYRVRLPGLTLELQVDRHCDELREWLRNAGHGCAALLSAHNPGSRLQDAEKNLRAQDALRSLLHQRGLPAYPGENLDPRGEWPAEASLLVPDLGREEARGLAFRFGQAAFLWCDASGLPRLQFTDAPPASP